MEGPMVQSTSYASTYATNPELVPRKEEPLASGNSLGIMGELKMKASSAYHEAYKNRDTTSHRPELIKREGNLKPSSGAFVGESSYSNQFMSADKAKKVAPKSESFAPKREYNASIGLKVLCTYQFYIASYKSGYEKPSMDKKCLLDMPCDCC